jgi:putative flippase GtrA
MRLIPERYRESARELMTFGTIGALNTLVDIALMNLLLFIGPIKAKAISTAVTTTLSYLMNRRWTFTSRQPTGAHRGYTLFFGLNLVGMLIQLIPLSFTKFVLHYSERAGSSDRLAFNIANLVGIGMATGFRYWSYRAFVFKTPPVPSDPDHQGRTCTTSPTETGVI